MDCVCTIIFTRDCKQLRDENPNCPMHRQEMARRELTQTLADIDKIRESVIKRLAEES